MFRTTRAVESGEELCHSDVDLALPREARREYLSSTYGFHCGCPACTAPEGSLASTDEVLLGRYSEGCCVEVGGLTMPPAVGEGGREGGGTTTPSWWVAEEVIPNPRHWVDLPKRVGLGVPTLSKGEGREVAQHTLTGVPSPLKKELLLACELVEAGRFSERPGGKDALAMFPIKLTEEALERVRFAAIGETSSGGNNNESEESGGTAGGSVGGGGGGGGVGVGVSVQGGGNSWVSPLAHISGGAFWYGKRWREGLGGGSSGSGGRVSVSGERGLRGGPAPPHHFLIVAADTKGVVRVFENLHEPCVLPRSLF
jgi:hypothetical protein